MVAPEIFPVSTAGRPVGGVGGITADTTANGCSVSGHAGATHGAGPQKVPSQRWFRAEKIVTAHGRSANRKLKVTK